MVCFKLNHSLKYKFSYSNHQDIKMNRDLQDHYITTSTVGEKKKFLGLCIDRQSVITLLDVNTKIVAFTIDPGLRILFPASSL
jgi:hypothetical protein